MRLRVHHLLCSALYVGEGYSEAFCRNMDQVVKRLWDSAEQEKEPEEIELVTCPDCICSECPNLTDKGCSLDNNNVVSKDAALAEKLGLKLGKPYYIPELLRQTAGNLSKEIFETSCHNCEWYQMGLCRYEKLAEKYKFYG